MKLVIATQNRGKLEELQQLLQQLPFQIVSLDAYPQVGEIDETGETFAENAAIKAEAVAAATGELSLADDSGLEVEALGGRPGVYSARFAGKGLGDQANNEKLLAELAAVPPEKRKARFRAVVAIARPGMSTIFAEGAVDGVIVSAPQGSGGFGYDPLFYVPETGKTFAEMSAAQKNKISHRARALAAAADMLRAIANGNHG